MIKTFSVILAVSAVTMAAYFYRESSRLSSEADLVEQDHLRLTGMLAAQARNEPNRDQLEQFRNELQNRYVPSTAQKLTANDLQFRLSDKVSALKSSAQTRLYFSLAGGGLAILAVVIFFTRRKRTRRKGEPSVD